MNTILSISNVTKRYPGQQDLALKGVSLDIHQGEVLALLGVNGAGKTTLSSIIATQHPCTSGDIMYEGQSIYDNLMNYRKAIGLCPQTPNLDTALTVRQNLMFAGRYYLIDEDELENRVDKLIKRFDLGKYENSSVTTLSGGYTRRVLIARELVHSPEIMILDEPTVALDPHIRHTIWDIVRELKDNGKTVILTTHYIEEADLLADRICILDSGKIKLVSTPSELKTDHAQDKLENVFVKLTNEETE